MIIFLFTQNNLTSQSFGNEKLYQSKTNDSEFPFNFILFDNAGGNYDLTLTDSLVFRSTRWVDFYLENNNEKVESLTKTVVPNIGIFLFICLIHIHLYILIHYQLQQNVNY